MSAASDTPWGNFSQSDYSLDQWKSACLVDSGQGDPNSKERYKLPVREPSGKLNVNGIHAAAARIGQVQPASKRAGAARKLIALYKEVGETPPDTLTGKAERSVPDVERLYTTAWSDSRCGIEVRSLGGGNSGSRTVGGYAAVFDTRSRPELGIREIVTRSFFNKSKGDGFPGVVCRFEHNPVMLLGATASGTLRVNTDDYGLDYEVDLPETRSDVYESIYRRDIAQSSFAFQCFDDDWKYDGGAPTRHLVSGRLIDVAPTATPAYANATVALRSLATFMDAPFEDVKELAHEDNLRVLFTRTDNIDKRDMSEYRSAPTVVINVHGTTADAVSVEQQTEVTPTPEPEQAASEPVAPQSEPPQPPAPAPVAAAPEPAPVPTPDPAPQPEPEPEPTMDPLIALTMLRERSLRNEV